MGHKWRGARKVGTQRPRGFPSPLWNTSTAKGWAFNLTIGVGLSTDKTARLIRAPEPRKKAQ